MASEYGGGIQSVAEHLSLLEVLIFVDKIEQRKADEWKMQTMISAFPHSEKDFKEKFMNMLDSMGSNNNKDNVKKLDKTGFEALKFMMAQNPRMIVKD